MKMDFYLCMFNDEMVTSLYLFDWQMVAGVGLEGGGGGGQGGGSTVEAAADRLVAALQAHPVLPPPPDPRTANIIRLWIQQVSLPLIALGGWKLHVDFQNDFMHFLKIFLLEIMILIP